MRKLKTEPGSPIQCLPKACPTTPGKLLNRCLTSNMWLVPLIAIHILICLTWLHWDYPTRKCALLGHDLKMLLPSLPQPSSIYHQELLLFTVPVLWPLAFCRYFCLARLFIIYCLHDGNTRKLQTESRSHCAKYCARTHGSSVEQMGSNSIAI